MSVDFAHITAMSRSSFTGLRVAVGEGGPSPPLASLGSPKRESPRAQKIRRSAENIFQQVSVPTLVDAQISSPTAGLSSDYEAYWETIAPTLGLVAHRGSFSEHLCSPSSTAEAPPLSPIANGSVLLNETDQALSFQSAIFGDTVVRRGETDESAAKEAVNTPDKKWMTSQSMVDAISSAMTTLEAMVPSASMGGATGGDDEDATVSSPPRRRRGPTSSQSLSAMVKEAASIYSAHGITVDPQEPVGVPVSFLAHRRNSDCGPSRSSDAQPKARHTTHTIARIPTLGLPRKYKKKIIPLGVEPSIPEEHEHDHEAAER